MGSTLEDVSRAAKFVSLPDVYLRLRSILDDPDFAMAEVAVAISQDPAITVRLLRLANSSLFGLTRKIETVSHAISMLGTQQVHDIVLSTSIAQAFKGMATEVMDMTRFWQRSVYCAAASRQLAAICGGCAKERLFVAGLLHDIGHLIMYQAIPEIAQQAIVAAGERNEPIYEMERELIGFDYAELGAELMLQWSLPESLTETTRFHIAPEKAAKYQLETSIVHLGALLTRSVGGERALNEGGLTVNPLALEIAGLTLEDCIDLRDQIGQDAQEIMSLMFPRDTVA